MSPLHILKVATHISTAFKWGSGWLTHCSTHGLQVAEEEAGDLSAPAEEEDEEELMEESMDEGEEGGGLPSLGKRRSTDTALSAQTGPKRPRPGSLAEVTPLLAHFGVII